MTTSLSEPHRRAAAFVLQIAPVCLAGTNLCGVSGTFTVARIVNTSFVCFERPPRRGHSAPPVFPRRSPSRPDFGPRSNAPVAGSPAGIPPEGCAPSQSCGGSPDRRSATRASSRDGSSWPEAHLEPLLVVRVPTWRGDHADDAEEQNAREIVGEHLGPALRGRVLLTPEAAEGLLRFGEVDGDLGARRGIAADGLQRGEERALRELLRINLREEGGRWSESGVRDGWC